MVQRGSRKMVMYTMKPRFVPVAESGKPLAAPQPRVEEVLPWIDLHIGDHVVLHTDGTKAYGPIIMEMGRRRKCVTCDSVNHSDWCLGCVHRA